MHDKTILRPSPIKIESQIESKRTYRSVITNPRANRIAEITEVEIEKIRIDIPYVKERHSMEVFKKQRKADL